MNCLFNYDKAIAIAVLAGVMVSVMRTLDVSRDTTVATIDRVLGYTK